MKRDIPYARTNTLNPLARAFWLFRGAQHDARLAVARYLRLSPFASLPPSSQRLRVSGVRIWCGHARECIDEAMECFDVALRDLIAANPWIVG